VTVTERYEQGHPAEVSAVPPETDRRSGEGAKSAPPAVGTPPAIWWLAALLLLLIAGIGSSPFWAHEVAPLLPWGSQPSAPAENYTDLAARLAAIEQRPAPSSPDVGAINSAARSV